MIRPLIILLLFSSVALAQNRQMLMDFDSRGFHFSIIEGDTTFYRVEKSYEHLDEAFMTFADTYRSEFPGDTAFLIYAHSLYGDFPLYKELSTSTLAKRVLDSSGLILLEINWGILNPLYGKNQQIAYQRGTQLARFLSLFSPSHFTFHSLHHSMGSKVFEGLMDSLPKNHGLGKVFLMAPDLDSQYIQNDIDLIKAKTDRLFIFHSKNDVLLQLSNLFTNNPRLGNMDSISLPSNHLQAYDTRKFDCELNNNHINWLTCPEVLDIVKEALSAIE